MNYSKRTQFNNNEPILFGDSSNVGVRWNSSTSKLEFFDSAGNVLMSLADAGTTGNLAVTGDAAVTGDLAVNGGDLTTTSTSFNLLGTARTVSLSTAAGANALELIYGSSTATASVVTLRGAAGSIRGYYLRSGTVNRWFIGAYNDAESTGDAGTSFKIFAYPDAGGSPIDAPITITRAANGAITLGRRLRYSSRTDTGTTGTVDAAPASIVFLNPGSIYNLTTISNGADGDEITLINVSANTVTIKDGTGNIECSADQALATRGCRKLVYSATLSKWLMMGNNSN